MSEAGNWVRVASVDDVEEGAAIPVETMGLQLAVYRLQGGQICVTDNICTHAFALLTDGWFENGVIECALHAGQFDVRTGKGLCAPIEEDLRTYKVRVEDGEILIELPD
ncbi:non-heme iron oxygenase ferredoxin subunit [Limobrevibacterium gyesilva]|uniref:Non-heme iron oxygenase ferredoxin subunit n=1 Tax=Limobrevibacterium gyesilva TaxID=2991712 RepID=A0AA41YKZ3_9PROT|nr:non-heme iron oxygenase ferredoxin subunit [Limobrevibacterium gyesilva]MCW3474311.1 non-heme iron oxygenase ferredoxin subunit [Limobrevibacterium gyesilva]